MLTEATLKAAVGKQKPYKLYDYAGLYLLVQQSGSRLWRLKYRLDDKEKCISLGIYPEVSLAIARRHRDHVRAQLRAGVDPMKARRNKRDSQLARHQSREFSLSISDAGELTISTRFQFMQISVQRTDALRAFLVVEFEKRGTVYASQ
jgi:hypothetical protein